jgi:hypothetical protein
VKHSSFGYGGATIMGTLHDTRFCAEVEHNPLNIYGGKIQFEQKLQRKMKYIMFRVLFPTSPNFRDETDFYVASSHNEISIHEFKV